MKSTSILLIFFILFVSSCKKSEPETKTDLLTSGKWQITAHREICYCSGSGYGTSTRDLYASYPACQKDDFYIFFPGGAVEVNEGAVKCNSNNAQSYTLYWNFMNNESSIQFNGTVWKIVQLKKTTFIISTIVILGTGESITFSKL